MAGHTAVGPEAAVTLRPVTAETVRAICSLRVDPDQEQFVAPNAVSIAEAHFSPVAWFRAIYADETPVGFGMLHDDAEGREYFLWRFMIAGEYQGKGYGRRALALAIDYARTRSGATELLTSYVPGDGCPRDFYAKAGFVETGEEEDSERVMRLALNGR